MAVAVAFTGAIVVASGDADARPRLRMFSSSPKPAAAATVAKSRVSQSPKPAAAEPQKPFAAARPAYPQPIGGSTLVVVGGPRPAGAVPGAAPQRAVGDESAGPLRYDPTPATAAAEKAAEPNKETAAAPATECAAPAQAATAKETLVAKEPSAARQTPKAEPAPARRNAALVPVHPKRQAPVVATVCYVQRDGTCAPAF